MIGEMDMRLVFPDGATFAVHVPLNRSPAEREQIRRLLGALVKSWDRAYDPQPCESCGGSGDERDVQSAHDGKERG
jgi:hypothetical protein